MPADSPLKQSEIEGVRKNRLREGVPDSGNGRDKGFCMPRNTLVRQPHTETVGRGCLTCTTGSGKRRRNDGPKFMRTTTKVNSIKNGEGGHSATKRERI